MPAEEFANYKPANPLTAFKNVKLKDTVTFYAKFCPDRSTRLRRQMMTYLSHTPINVVKVTTGFLGLFTLYSYTCKYYDLSK